MSLPNGDAAPPTIGDALGLGPHWTPLATMAWQWGKVGTPAGAIHVLKLSTAVGLLAVPFTQDGLEAFARATMQQATGLVIPPAG